MRDHPEKTTTLQRLLFMAFVTALLGLLAGLAG